MLSGKMNNTVGKQSRSFYGAHSKRRNKPHVRHYLPPPKTVKIGQAIRFEYETIQNLQQGDTLQRSDGLCFIVQECKRNDPKNRNRWFIRAFTSLKPSPGSAIRSCWWYPSHIKFEK